MTEWIDIESRHRSQGPHFVLSSRRIRLSASAVRQLRESAGLSDDDVLSIRIRTNPEKTKLAITAESGLIVQKGGHTSGFGLHTSLGKPAQPIRMALDWDAREKMFVGEIPQ